jgi:hypothetical protein
MTLLTHVPAPRECRARIPLPVPDNFMTLLCTLLRRLLSVLVTTGKYITTGGPGVYSVGQALIRKARSFHPDMHLHIQLLSKRCACARTQGEWVMQCTHTLISTVYLSTCGAGAFRTTRRTGQDQISLLQGTARDSVDATVMTDRPDIHFKLANGDAGQRRHHLQQACVMAAADTQSRRHLVAGTTQRFALACLTQERLGIRLRVWDAHAKRMVP